MKLGFRLYGHDICSSQVGWFAEWKRHQLPKDRNCGKSREFVGCSVGVARQGRQKDISGKRYLRFFSRFSFFLTWRGDGIASHDTCWRSHEAMKLRDTGGVKREWAHRLSGFLLHYNKNEYKILLHQERLEVFSIIIFIFASACHVSFFYFFIFYGVWCTGRIRIKAIPREDSRQSELDFIWEIRWYKKNSFMA